MPYGLRTKRRPQNAETRRAPRLAPGGSWNSIGTFVTPTGAREPRPGFRVNAELGGSAVDLALPKRSLIEGLNVLAEPTPEVRPSHHRASVRRRIRAPWTPASAVGRYRLPASILDRLSRDLAPFRNRDSAMALAVLLARFWSAPGRLAKAFPVDRRALADRADLGLTESQVRGALATLERVGFLARPPIVGRTHQATPDGELHRRPILWRFSAEVIGLFRAVHGARRTTPGADLRHGGTLDARARSCPPARPAVASATSPKGTAPAASPVIMGDQNANGSPLKGSRWEKPSPATPCPALGAALDRLIAARAARLGG